MIRLVTISKDDEVVPGEKCFAWFDTVTDTFLKFSGEMVWTRFGDFRNDWAEDPLHDIARYEKLFKGWKK